VAAAGLTGVELIVHDVIPGHQALNQLDGNCSVAKPPVTFAPGGSSMSGQFLSVARNRMVGYTIAYPPGHAIGSRLPLVVALHAFDGDHTRVLPGLSLVQALAMQISARPLAPMAMVAADGGNGYWHPQPGDDPMGMLINEVIPRCQHLGLGVPPDPIGVLGVSMGGYGALLLAEKQPALIKAVAAISPAVWTNYRQASAANRNAFGSAGEFSANDVIQHAQSLSGVAVRIASGRSDPFHANVVALAKALPGSPVLDFSGGCHTEAFFAAALPPSSAFLGQHLSST
jgi:pimeloyl-ACP methyl ester carboxylesterase